ncbi:hypothetical protein EZS27_001774 [termite gut metagenome]|uniref:DNA replication protein DnaC n=1 Tax=termite gut metagenome TaxID=433724 RepID=A0A5J4SY38_9ZZZZ
MEQPIDMPAIFDKINQRGLFRTITRYSYLPYNMNLAMQVVDAIGKKRNPKFQIDHENRFTYENLIRWIHADPEMKRLDPATKEVVSGRLDAGIYLAGNTGSGKSWTLEIMAAYCLIDNVQIALGETKRCLYWSNVRTGAVCDEYTATGSVERFKKMNIIGIQDLGAEPPESMYMGNRINVMRQILEHRGDQTDQLTLITSNLPMNHKRLVDRYDDRVASRLNEMCNYFEITGTDRRKI